MHALHMTSCLVTTAGDCALFVWVANCWTTAAFAVVVRAKSFVTTAGDCALFVWVASCWTTAAFAVVVWTKSFVMIALCV